MWMAECTNEPEESVDYTYIREDGNCETDSGCPLKPSFSFEDGHALQEKVCDLEKELANVLAKVNSLCSKTKDESNEETRSRRIENVRVGQLIVEIDAMKKELILSEEYRQSLREQLNRADCKAKEERAAVESYYEEQLTLLRSQLETTAHVSKLRLLDRLDSHVSNLEKSCDNRNNRVLREVHFTVKLVQNDNSEHSHQHYLSCYSCKESYNPDDMTETCLFHPLPAMKRAKWERDWGLDVDTKKYHNYCYWACCNTLARKRPCGCCKGRHHQTWECDILLKKAMQVNQSNTITMLERSISKVNIITD